MARVNAIPETVNISSLPQRKLLLGRLELLVSLVQDSTPAALLVSVGQWNRLADDLEDLEDAVTALKTQLALARGDTDLVDWHEVEAELTKAGRVPLTA